MSTQTTQQQPAAVQLPDVDSAYATIFNGVHKRAFFHKLASLGYKPKDVHEETALLELGAKLAQVSNEPLLQPQAAPNLYTKASSALDNVLAEKGISLPNQQKQASQHNESQLAAQQLMQDPTIVASAIVVKQALQAASQQAAA